jgi:sialic acid synthase SpsE
MSEGIKISEKEFLKNRTIETFKNLSVFDKYMIEESAKQKSMVETIKTLKSGNSELTHKDVEAILLEIRERHYTLFMIDKDARASVESLTELLRICKELGIELNLEENDQKILDSMLEGNIPLYKIQDGTLVVADKDRFDSIFDAIKSKNSTDTLESFFNSDLFK